MKAGQGHTPETIARIRAKMSDPAKRAQISQDTKARMADPAVRQRIRDGMEAASGVAVELQVLRAAWLAARPKVRRRFLDDLLHPACGDDDTGGDQ